MPTKAVNDWISHYAKGRMTSLELVSLLFARATAHAEEIGPVLAALQSHSDPHLQWAGEVLADLLSKGKHR